MNELLAILTQELPPNLYFFEEEIKQETLASLCEQYQFHFYYLDGKKIKNKSDFLGCCGEVMNFPDYFGYNWDAFEDCLTDIVSTQDTPSFIFYSHSENFANNDFQEWEIMRNIWQSAIEFLRKHKITLYVGLQRS